MYDRVDNYWAKVFGIQTATGDKKFNLLARAVKSALCIHHGNADVERSLSDSKNTVTDEGTRLSESTFNSLRLAKDFIHAHNGGVSKVMVKRWYKLEEMPTGPTSEGLMRRRKRLNKERS